MIGKFFEKLFAGTPKTVECESFEYKGYTVTPTPEPGQGDFYTAGTISKVVDDEERTVKFIRADRHASAEQAEQHIQVKAKQIIDEQGDAIFRSSQI